MNFAAVYVCCTQCIANGSWKDPIPLDKPCRICGPHRSYAFAPFGFKNEGKFEKIYRCDEPLAAFTEWLIYFEQDLAAAGEGGMEEEYLGRGAADVMNDLDLHGLREVSDDELEHVGFDDDDVMSEDDDAPSTSKQRKKKTTAERSSTPIITQEQIDDPKLTDIERIALIFKRTEQEQSKKKRKRSGFTTYAYAHAASRYDAIMVGYF